MLVTVTFKFYEVICHVKHLKYDEYPWNSVLKYLAKSVEHEIRSLCPTSNMKAVLVLYLIIITNLVQSQQEWDTK